MYKSTIGCLALLFPIGAFATGMCVHTNSYVAQLSTSIDGTSSTTGDGGAFTVTFPYPTSNLTVDGNPVQTVTGSSSCNEVSASAQYETKSTLSGVSGESTGTNCWCAMKKPFISYWVYLNNYGSNTSCASSCANACATAVKSQQAMRTAMFKIIWG